MSAPMPRTWSSGAWRPAACAAACCGARSPSRPIIGRSKTSTAAAARGIVAISGVDTRALAALIREQGMPNAVIAHAPDGKFDLAALKREAAAWPGMIGLDLAKDVTCGQSYSSDETGWRWGEGYGRQETPRFHVVAIDYGLKRNILRELAGLGCRLTVVPATTSARRFWSGSPTACSVNGPGDPAATGTDAVPESPGSWSSPACRCSVPPGHQMLGRALGGTTAKNRIRAITARTTRSRTTPPIKSRSPR